ncbi:MAG TPA: tRNA 2-selenouridine(34) synthase MnmH, partial [Ferruginibacter sp.]|nr:tRNA 2-selenouridine(34) synthase MnmH [Ferruginibacter sp.]
LDVRSPGEYTHAHIPGAHNLPLFSDEERKEVGTRYKQISREAAIKIGLDYFGVKMRKMVEAVEQLTGNSQLARESWQPLEGKAHDKNGVLVHCWRGGMRSAAVAWLLELYGFNVYLLVGGYKAYRKWVLAQFEHAYSFRIIGGYTGSGKTLLLRELGKQGNQIIDLEALASHKGSAFGALGEMPQPKQEMFENMLANALFATRCPLGGEQQLNTSNDQQAGAIFIEDESQRIGNLQIPMALWYTMRKSPVYFVDIPFEERLDYITRDYGKHEKEKLVNAVIRIQKRLGGLDTRNAINFLVENNFKECFRILLNYYDKWYGKALLNRENIATLLNKIPCDSVDTVVNTNKLLSCFTVSPV